MSIFGARVAVIYVLVGLILAVAGGTIIEKLKLDNEIEEFIRKAPNIDIDEPEMELKDRISYAREKVAETVKKVSLYIFIGVGIGSVIHNVIPGEFVEQLLGADRWYSVPLATSIGIPMYADIFGTIPIAESLFMKNAGLGTVLSFMMGVTALSLPSMIMLRKAVKQKLLVIFFGIVAGGIICIGYMFNILQFAF